MMTSAPEVSKEYGLDFMTSEWLKFIEYHDAEWVKQFAQDLSVSPQRKGVVLDCIKWKVKELTSVDDFFAINYER